MTRFEVPGHSHLTAVRYPAELRQTLEAAPDVVAAFYTRSRETNRALTMPGSCR